LNAASSDLDINREAKDKSNQVDGLVVVKVKIMSEPSLALDGKGLQVDWTFMRMKIDAQNILLFPARRKSSIKSRLIGVSKKSSEVFIHFLIIQNDIAPSFQFKLKHSTLSKEVKKEVLKLLLINGTHVLLEFTSEESLNDWASKFIKMI
jgi:hypothetical protein